MSHNHLTSVTYWLAMSLAVPVLAAGSATQPKPTVSEAITLPPMPEKLPRWIGNTQRNHIFYKRGRYNFDVYNIDQLARDLNGVAVGHAMAYEDLVTGKTATLETKTYQRIDWVLKHPPRLMPDEAALSPTFGRKYGVLEQVFDWTHVLHAQTIDVLASKRLTATEKDREIERLWNYYFDSVPYAVTPLPLNMEYLYSQPYSQKFRRTYPKVNGLFWGYHWLQNVMYDTLYRTPLEWQRKSYGVIGERYRTTELHRTDRPFMPMFAEQSPVFAARFPHIANAFDNLHMLHDMVNDILATPGLSDRQRDDQIKRAIWLVSAEAHRGEKPGDRRGEGARERRSEGATGAPNSMTGLNAPELIHDHRFFNGMAGMGIMKGASNDPQPAVMWMDGMGWMSMADCHHCSMPLWEGEDAWRNSLVLADGKGMRVRCALCARDYSAETKGKAVLHIATELPDLPVILVADEQGNFQTSQPDAVFVELESSHAGCETWSRAFTSRAAFEAHLRAHPELKGAKLLTFQEWSERQGDRPDTYVKPRGPVENPYADQPATGGNQP